MHVAFVCTGNICRSAVAERLTSAFAAELGRWDLTASSSGTAAVVGSGMEPSSAAALVELGGDPEGFRARRFEARHAHEADLVLTMTRAHRRTVLQQAPRALARTFTLGEAAELLRALPAGPVLPGADDLTARGAALVAALSGARSARGAAAREAADVPDPVGQLARVHLAVADRIADDLFPLLQVLTGLRTPALV